MIIKIDSEKKKITFLSVTD